MREYDKREGNPGKDRGSTFKYRGEDPEAISTGLNDNYADACESIYAALLDTGESVVYARATPRDGWEGSLIRTLMFTRLTLNMKSSGSIWGTMLTHTPCLERTGAAMSMPISMPANFVRMHRAEGKTV